MAITCSSFVRMTRTATRLAAAELTSSFVAFCFSSSSIPISPSPPSSPAVGDSLRCQQRTPASSARQTPPRMRRSISCLGSKTARPFQPPAASALHGGANRECRCWYPRPRIAWKRACEVARIVSIFAGFAVSQFAQCAIAWAFKAKAEVEFPFLTCSMHGGMPLAQWVPSHAGGWRGATAGSLGRQARGAFQTRWRNISRSTGAKP